MKKIIGLDLGTTSIGWAYIHQAESDNEQSSIQRIGVRVNPLTVDELGQFEKGKSITTNADRTLKRGMRRNLQRYKLRREQLISLLKEHHLITDQTLLSEQGNYTTFQTYRLRAKAATERISLEEFARVLLMINKKRGYKSSRKAKSADDGQAIDGMAIAKQLYDNNLTPGQYTYQLLSEGKNIEPDFYRSDLFSELHQMWDFQQQYYPDILTDETYQHIMGKGKTDTSKYFYAKYSITEAENKNKGIDRKLIAYQWRTQALNSQLSKEQLVAVISDINGKIHNTSGLLSDIGDNSKFLYFNHLTVGQYLMQQLDKNPNFSLKNQIFYRQDYLNEFEQIWEKQAQYYSELTPQLKHDIRDITIFYQRPLRSQKGLIDLCPFESHIATITIDGKTKTKRVGHRVCPKSSPQFQDFRIRQLLNNIIITGPSQDDPSQLVSRPLNAEERDILFDELSYRESLSKKDALKLLYSNHKQLDLNFDKLEGNRTRATLIKACLNIIEISGHEVPNFDKLTVQQGLSQIHDIFSALGFSDEFLQYDNPANPEQLQQQPLFKLWHLLYSYEGDNSTTGISKLINHIEQRYHLDTNSARILANVTFEPDYASLSTKAILKILPYLEQGHQYDEACTHAGYRHSATSLTREEIDAKILVDHLDLLPRNSLRNPVVEKILNQMINVVNQLIATYGQPDEIHIELARELKKNAAERAELLSAINKTTKEYKNYRKIIQQEFGFDHVSRNDIIRYRLYLELKPRGYKTLYSNTYIPREKIFSKEFDIEHIIPQARLFDDSFSNKTLESRQINIEKSNDTAYDFILKKYGQSYAENYLAEIDQLVKDKQISRTKARNLKMRQADIPSDFIDRDLRNSQYIARKAAEILSQVAREIIPTTGSITDRLREDWGLINIMQQLNWDKYNQLGLTQTYTDHDGRVIGQITNWTKRNDHRHHAMDALTIAFTKRSHIKYLNTLNSRLDHDSEAYKIECSELARDEHNHLRFKLPFPDFRNQALQQLSSVLVSIKAKNKVTTQNVNKIRIKSQKQRVVQLTPRGELHKQTVYGQRKQRCTKLITIGSKTTLDTIIQVQNPQYRTSLIERLRAFADDPKKAFTGKNSLDKNPIYLDPQHTTTLPSQVTIEYFETIYTIRKAITPDLNIDKVLDPVIKQILLDRLDQYHGNAQEAFSNLDEKPIYINEEKGISLKRVTLSGIATATPLHDKRDKEGNLILNAAGQPIPTDYVSTGNNHHVAIFIDAKGNWQEHIVSFFEATARSQQGLPIIDKEYNHDLGWKFQFTLKQNEYFIFPSADFDPSEIDLLNPNNYPLISPHLYRVQKLSTKDYYFRHHLETTLDDNNVLRDTTWKRIRTLSQLSGIIKVRINHIGQIVSVGEY